MRISDLTSRGASALLLLLGLALVGAVYSINASASAATREAPVVEWAGAMSLGENFCLTVGATPVNLTSPTSWTAPVQARLTTARLGQMRYLSVKLHSTPGTTCVGAPGASPGAAMTCAPAATPDTSGFPLYSQGESITLLLDRTPATGGTTGALPAVYAVASGEGSVVCLAFSGGVQ